MSASTCTRIHDSGSAPEVAHPALSWAPVAALGAMNAVIYKAHPTSHALAVAAHMADNTVIVAFRDSAIIPPRAECPSRCWCFSS